MDWKWEEMLTTQRKEKIIATLGGEEYCFDERDFATISCLETQEEEEVVVQDCQRIYLGFLRWSLNSFSFLSFLW